MPVLNRRGDAAHGKQPVCINGAVPPALVDVVGGGPEWLTDDVMLYNRQAVGGYMTDAYDRTTGRVSEVTTGANKRYAGAGVWATFDPYADSLGRVNADWAPLAVDDTTGAIIVVKNRHAGAELTALYPDREVLIHRGVIDSPEVCAKGGVVGYRAGGQYCLWRESGVQAIDDLGVLGVRHSGGWRVGFHNRIGATVIHRIGETRGIVVSTGDFDFNPDICFLGLDHIRVATSAGQLELPSELKVFDLNPMTAVYVDLRTAGTTTTPSPLPPPPVHVPEVPMSLSAREITDVVTEAKAEVEALGYRFKTVEEASRDDYAHYTYADKQLAFLVTMRAAWKLAQKYPDAGIGLELYNGPSGTPSPFPEDGSDRYSGDIILLSKSGPSVDILIAGVQPAAQIDTTTDPQAPSNWRRDWRAPLNPYRGQTVPAPVPTPTPVPVPVPVPTPTPAPTVDAVMLADIQANLHALRDEFSEYRLQMAEMEVVLRNEIRAIAAPSYNGTAKGGWPVGNITFTLTPKEPE